jgi:hypothetical protein
MNNNDLKIKSDAQFIYIIRHAGSDVRTINEFHGLYTTG